MRAICLGGGPAGLYFAISLKLRQPTADVTVLERNKPDDTFGWGVVLSDETLDNLEQNDPFSASEIRSHFAYWDDIALHHKGQVITSSGHGFCGIGRKKLLLILQDRARALGVDLQFETEVKSASAYMDDYDLKTHSSLILICAVARSYGWGHTRNSTTPLRLFLRRPTKAGSGFMPINSTPIRRPLSWNVRKKPMTLTALAR
jgi:predicted flavoprotein YhiN